MPEIAIAGQGIAGTALAWHLHWLGCPFLVVDPGSPDTSSRIAAGIVNPITGRRVALSWRVHEFLPAAIAFYRRTARELGRSFFHDLPNVRLFRNDDEARRFASKRSDPAFAAFVSRNPADPLVPPDEFLAPPVGFEAVGGGWLDTRGWLDASAAFFAARGRLRRGAVPPESAVPGEDSVRVIAGDEPLRARTLVFCQGAEAAGNPWFPWVTWKSAKGEILTLRISGLAERRIVHRGGWLLPEGGDRFRAGSTYAWDTLDNRPTAEGAAAIEARLRPLLRIPWQVIGHKAAVRPVIRESRALVGRHPARPSLAFFNGLGSKGVMHAPLFADILARHLVDNQPIDPAFDIAGNHT